MITSLHWKSKRHCGASRYPAAGKFVESVGCMKEMKASSPMEQIEKDFPAFLEDFRWQLVRGAVMKQGDLKVEKEDMMESAMVMARYQFAMYGLTNVSDEHLVTFAESMLGNEKEARNLYERAEENKVISYIRENVTLDFKEA